MPIWMSRAVRVIGILSLVWATAPEARGALAAASYAPARELSLEAQTAQAGPVTIKVTSPPSDSDLSFSITLDTHSVDLDAYDLSLLAAIRTDQGVVIESGLWEAAKGGHHREGTLVFSLLDADGNNVLGSETRALELVIRNVGGVAETVIQWTLEPSTGS